MNNPASLAKIHFEQALSASIRALSRHNTAQFDPATSPVTDIKPSLAQLQVVRGAADAAALMLRYHSPAIHQAHMQDIRLAQDIFTKAEETRVESLGSIRMKGVAANITAMLESYALIAGYNHITGHEVVPLADIVGFLLRETLTGIKPPVTARALMACYGALVKEKIAAELQLLPEHIEDQEAFAEGVATLIARLYIQDSDVAERAKTEAVETTEPRADPGEAQQETAYDAALSAALAETATQVELESMPPTEGEVEESDTENTVEHTDSVAANASAYHPYSSAFDEVITAEALSSPEELTRLRLQLDSKLEQLKNITARLAHRLQRKLIARQRCVWEPNQEEGVIDTSRLPQLIASPSYTHYYKKEKKQEQLHTMVTLLLDNSGSMRGRPITIAAMSADVLARTLERCGIKVEILGFTTCEWKGGKTRKLWLEEGKTPHPGRLNDLRHIIYKSADMPWRRARKNLGLMLKEGILKENIDGEAILWAHARMLKRPEKRRILMVISDGAPVDDSTSSANDSLYLEQHLRSVIRVIEKDSPVELLAIGIGHDVGRYYSHAVTIREAEQLGDTMFRELSALL